MSVVLDQVDRLFTKTGPTPRSFGTPRVGCVCPWPGQPGRQVYLLDEDWREYTLITLPLDATSRVVPVPKRQFQARVRAWQEEKGLDRVPLKRQPASYRITKEPLEDQMPVTARFREVHSLSDKQREAMVQSMEKRLGVLCRSVSKNDHTVYEIGPAPWSVIERVSQCRLIELMGLDAPIPNHITGWLSGGLYRDRLEFPTIGMAERIEDGLRLDLADCHERHIEPTLAWNGEVRVQLVHTCTGQPMFEVLAGRKGSALYDWWCDQENLADAVDLAALLRASFSGIRAELWGEQ